MNKPNITSVYSIQNPNGKKSFFYSTRQDTTQFNYYLLEEDEAAIPRIRRINHAIDLLQDHSKNIARINMDSEDYSLFITQLSQAIRPSIKSERFKEPLKVKKYIPPFPRNKKR
ncbi:MAG TPA: hypothetical protein DCE23_08425 [Firmicutes bacterium]|nr:hypothetical protein [Bacillota bacterium]